MDLHEHSARWSDAMLAGTLFAVDPCGLGGVCLRARSGPVRDRWIDCLRRQLPAAQVLRRMPSHIAESRLLGGLDLAATLNAGRPVAQRGLLAEADGSVVLAPMAERLDPAVQSHLCAALDRGELCVEREGLTLQMDVRIGVIALDEGIEDDEQPGAALKDRLAFHLDLDGMRLPTAHASDWSVSSIETARALLPKVQIAADLIEGLCAVALSLGIVEVRASLLAARVARACAALGGRGQVVDEDAATAARLVLVPRARCLPPAPEEAPQEETSPEPAPADAQAMSAPEETLDSPADDSQRSGSVHDLLLAAAQAAIPPGLLERLRQSAAQPSASRVPSQGRSGALKRSLLRGRPAGVRRGDPAAGMRLSLIETLRAAAPWQSLRRAQRRAAVAVSGAARTIEVRREDFHVTRYQQRQQTTTLFVVDASGSSALNRLAEAKGAVELLLAECYVRRDQVAVIAFRGAGAELLLPPTRSLLRAKRSLAGLPGGGGTPLAAGLDAALALTESLRRRGETPTLVLLTDGRANVTREGAGNREVAQSQATDIAHRIRAIGVRAIFIDTSPRPQPDAQRLAQAMDARYLALPHADAQAVSAVVIGANRARSGNR